MIYLTEPMDGAAARFLARARLSPWLRLGGMPSPESPDQARWFAEEVHAHDASLKAYLRAAFPAVRDFEDVVQESYLRIWRARTSQSIRSARAFLFTVARRVALNLVERERVSPIDRLADLSRSEIVEDRPTAAEATCAQEELMLLADGIESLPARCRQVLILRKIEGLPQKEIAARLGISEQTVQVLVLRGVKRCEAFLRRRGASGRPHGTE